MPLTTTRTGDRGNAPHHHQSGRMGRSPSLHPPGLRAMDSPLPGPGSAPAPRCAKAMAHSHSRNFCQAEDSIPASPGWGVHNSRPRRGQHPPNTLVVTALPHTHAEDTITRSRTGPRRPGAGPSAVPTTHLPTHLPTYLHGGCPAAHLGGPPWPRGAFRAPSARSSGAAQPGPRGSRCARRGQGLPGAHTCRGARGAPAAPSLPRARRRRRARPAAAAAAAASIPGSPTPRFTNAASAGRRRRRGRRLRPPRAAACLTQAPLRRRR